MSNAWFFEKFELIADLPDAVSRMREIVLELAFQGAFHGEINSEVTELGSISVRIHYGFTAKADHSQTTVRMLRITDIQDNQVNWETVPGCDISATELPKYKLEQGDILIARTGGTVGKSFLIREPPPTAVFASYLIRITPNAKVLSNYLKRFLESPCYWKQLHEGARGAAQPNVNGRTLAQIQLPLPPLSEQRRIVAKVEELMGICDRLELEQRERESSQRVLVRSSLQRFSEEASVENLGYLFHRSYTVSPSDLRKTILTLAVQGKLVPQDPAEGSAEELAKKIELEKCRLMENSTIKADKKLWLNSTSEPYFEIPRQWCWVRLQDVFEISRGSSPRPAGDPRFFGGTIPWITVGEITKDARKFLTSTSTGLTREGAERSRYINPGDLLLTNSGATLGVPKISKIRACMNDGVAVLRLFHNANLNDFAYLYLTQQTSAFRNIKQGMGQPNLNTPIIAAWYFPLPPLAEQRRIVAKVEELMSMVDELEEMEKQATDRGSSLLDAIVHELAATAG